MEEMWRDPLDLSPECGSNFFIEEEPNLYSIIEGDQNETPSTITTKLYWNTRNSEEELKFFKSQNASRKKGKKPYQQFEDDDAIIHLEATFESDYYETELLVSIKKFNTKNKDYEDFATDIFPIVREEDKLYVRVDLNKFYIDDIDRRRNFFKVYSNYIFQLFIDDSKICEFYVASNKSKPSILKRSRKEAILNTVPGERHWIHFKCANCNNLVVHSDCVFAINASTRNDETKPFETFLGGVWATDIDQTQVIMEGEHYYEGSSKIKCIGCGVFLGYKRTKNLAEKILRERGYAYKLLYWQRLPESDKYKQVLTWEWAEDATVDTHQWIGPPLLKEQFPHKYENRRYKNIHSIKDWHVKDKEVKFKPLIKRELEFLEECKIKDTHEWKMLQTEMDKRDVGFSQMATWLSESRVKIPSTWRDCNDEEVAVLLESTLSILKGKML